MRNDNMEPMMPHNINFNLHPNCGELYAIENIRRIAFD